MASPPESRHDDKSTLAGLKVWSGRRRCATMGMDAGSRSLWSLWSTDSLLCIGCRGSVLSIGSIGSAASIGSIGSFASIGSVGSALSVTSALSWLSLRSVLSARSTGAVRAAGDLGRPGRSSLIAVLTLAAVAGACGLPATGPDLRGAASGGGGGGTRRVGSQR